MRDSYRLQMCSMGLLSAPLTEQEMNALFQIHHCDTFSLTEQTSSEAWQAMQQRFLEKVGSESGGRWLVVCRVLRGAQHARREGLRLLGTGGDGADRRGHAHRLGEHAHLHAGHAFGSFFPLSRAVGGVPVILPMFVPASSEVSVSHLPALAPRPLPSRAYAQAFSLLAILLQEDPSQLVTFKNNGGVQLLAILLRRCPPSHLSVELVTVIQQIVEALKRDPELYIDGVRYLLFDFSVWGSAPWQTHVVVLRLLSDVVSQNPLMVKNHVGIRPLLQALVKIYYSEVSEYSCKRDESFAEDLVGELQTSVVEMIRMMLDAESSAYRVDVSYLLSVLYMVDDPDIALPILQLFYDFMMACSLLFFAL